jgi:transposase InsO family protein
MVMPKRGDASEVAMLRFSLIAPVVNGTYTQPSKAAYFRDVSERPVALPDGTVRHFNPNTLATWESRYRRLGFDGLARSGRSDAGKSRKIGPEEAAAIRALREAHPRTSCVEMRRRLIADGTIGADDFSVSTIQRWVRANLPRGAANPRLRDRRAFEEEWANGMWQADTLYGPHVSMPDGRLGRAYLQMVLDDKSRMVVAARFVQSDSGANFLVLLKGAVATYGVPRKLYVDNGAPYSNAQLTGACGRIGCVLIHTRVRDGASKGKVERANRALRNELLNNLDPSVRLTLVELNDLLAEWVLRHNSKPHSAHGKAPSAAWAADAARVPPRMPDSEAWLDEAFTCREVRRVHKDASVFVQRVRFEAPACLIGTRAEVRWLPGDLSRAWCALEDGSLREMRPTDRAANSRARRDNAYSIDWSEEA